MGAKSILVLAALIICLTDVGRKQEVGAQDTKGGQSGLSSQQQQTKSDALKGGGRGVSSFRQNIASLQRKQLVAQTSQRPLQVEQQQQHHQEQDQEQHQEQHQEQQHQDNALSGGSSTSSSSSLSSAPFSAPTLPERPQLVVQQQKQVLRVVNEQRLITNSIDDNNQQQQQAVQVQLPAAIPEPAVYGSVSGSPGIDFPAYTAIPNTKFTCDQVPFTPGMYADESTGCQVYHLCYQGRKESFLCGIGTLFNQAIMNCDFWHSVECSRSSQYFHLNADFGKSSPEPVGGSQLQQTSSSFSSATKGGGGGGGKTSFPSLTSLSGGGKTWPNKQQQQQFTAFRPLQAPASNFRRTSSFVSSSKSRTAETPAAQISLSGLDGKVSAPRQRLAKQHQHQHGLLSPSRQTQLKFGQERQEQQEEEQQQDQLMMNSAASSTRFKVTSSELLSGQKGPSLAVGSSLNVADSSSSSSGSQAAKTAAGGAQARWRAKGSRTLATNEIMQTSRSEHTDEWRPYFKSKTQAKGKVAGAPSAPSPPPTSGGPHTAATRGGGANSEPPPPAVTVRAPDQEPNFPSATGAPPTPELPAAAEVSRAPKSGPPGATTSPASQVETTTTTPTVTSVTTATNGLNESAGLELSAGSASTGAPSSAQPEEATASTASAEEANSTPATSSAVEYAKTEAAETEAREEGAAAATAASPANNSSASAGETSNAEPETTTTPTTMDSNDNGFEKRNGKKRA